MGRQDPPPINTTSAPAVLPVTSSARAAPLNAEAFSSVARRRQDLWLSSAWIVQDARLGRTLRLGKSDSIRSDPALGFPRIREHTRGRMSREDWQPAREESRLDTEPFSELCRKVVLCVTEDWFVLSHFQPLIAVLKEVAHAVVVVTRSSGRLSEIEALGARVVDFDFRRSSSNPHAPGPVGVGAGAHSRGRGWRCRPSGGDEAGGPGRACPQAGAGWPRGRAHDGAGISGLRLRPLAAALSRRGAAPDGVDAAQALLVPAGREPGRSGAAARGGRRPRSALRHPGRRRCRLRGLPGHAAAAQRLARGGLRRAA